MHLEKKMPINSVGSLPAKSPFSQPAVLYWSANTANKFEARKQKADTDNYITRAHFVKMFIWEKHRDIIEQERHNINTLYI